MATDEQHEPTLTPAEDPDSVEIRVEIMSQGKIHSMTQFVSGEEIRRTSIPGWVVRHHLQRASFSVLDQAGFGVTVE